MTPEQVSYWLVFSPSHSSQQLYLKTHDPWWHLWEWNNCTIFSSWLFAYLESCDEKTSQKWPWRYYGLCFSPYYSNFCFVLFLYGFRLSSVACLYANMPNVPFAVYEGSWFSSCKCNALINPPSKTSSRQAVSINWGERQQGLILWREIPVECRVAERRSCQKRDLNFEEMNDWCDFVPKSHVIECDAKDSSHCFVACERNSLKITLNSRTEQ